MGRKRLSENEAERQKAYRTRKAQQAEVVPATEPKKVRPLSRPKRLAAIIDQVEQLLSEYEDWRDSLPESLQETEQADELAETIDLLIQAAEPLRLIQPPLGFGRVRR